MPSWYIGSSYEEKVLNGYNGSVGSKKYKEIYLVEQRAFKHLFKSRILSYHETRQEALDEELRLQKKHLVVKNNKYYNQSYAQVNGCHGMDVTGENHPMYGKTHSEKSMNQMVESRRNKTGDYHPNGNRSAKRYLYTSPSGKTFEVYSKTAKFCKEHNIDSRSFERISDNQVVVKPKIIKKSTPDRVLNTSGWKRKLL